MDSYNSRNWAKTIKKLGSGEYSVEDLAFYRLAYIARLEQGGQYNGPETYNQYVGKQMCANMGDL